MSALGNPIFQNSSVPSLYYHNDNAIDVKVCTVGESSVGKSSIIKRMSKGTFNQLNNSATIGGAFIALHQTRGNRKYVYKIWDTAGQERFKSLVPMYLKNSRIVLLIFDITDKSSYNSAIEFWYDYIKKTAPLATIILIGNKSDLEKNRKIKKTKVKTLAKDLGMIYMESSAKTGDSIGDLKDKLMDVTENNINQIIEDQRVNDVIDHADLDEAAVSRYMNCTGSC